MQGRATITNMKQSLFSGITNFFMDGQGADSVKIGGRVIQSGGSHVYDAEKQQVVSETHSPKIRVQSISPPGTAGRMTTKNMTSTTNSING